MSDMDKKLAEAIATMRPFIEALTRTGFQSEEDVVLAGVEYLDGEADASLLLPHAKEIAKAAFLQLEQDQLSWPDVTDCDRLDAAFAELDASGIFSRQDFWCCQTCANGAIDDEMQAALEEGRHVRGYTYYHWQDTEGAVEGGGLRLAYGSIEEGKEKHLAIGNEVVSTLEKHGLQPKWDSNLGHRIEVPMDWKRRRRANNE